MSLVEVICRELRAKKRLALVSVVKQLASAPRHAGARMLCGVDGHIAGSIGGGILEGQAVERAREVAASGLAEFLDARLTAEEAAGNGMACGGEVRSFIEPLVPDSRTMVLFDRLLVAERHADDMFTVVPVTAPGQRRACRLAADRWPLPVSISGELKTRVAGSGLSSPIEFSLGLGQHFVIIPWPAPWLVVLAGGGHVSQACARLAVFAGFACSVMDDREEFAAPERFPDTVQTRTVPDYADCFAGAAPSRRTMLVIATRGHMHDERVLAQALRTDAGWIGMIGSAKKLAAVSDHLRAMGFSDTDLARVNLPVGLSIGAETPEEIAVSITAQLIAARAAQSGRTRHLDPALAGRVTLQPAP